jgi:hypothetical protein
VTAASRYVFDSKSDDEVSLGERVGAVEEMGVERAIEDEPFAAREETQGERTRSVSGTAVQAVEYRDLIRGSVDFQSVEVCCRVR